VVVTLLLFVGGAAAVLSAAGETATPSPATDGRPVPVTAPVAAPSAPPAEDPVPAPPAPEVAAPKAEMAEAQRPAEAPLDDELTAPSKVTPRPAVKTTPVRGCTWSDDFKALARKDHQALQQLAAKRGVPRATLDALEDAFGDAMVKQDCRGATRVLDKLRRHAPSP
jgi:pyruvate/2-oxoglutarate dehydrogenase complex dihydrolipoamide acyltransferase (E2) component